MSKASILIKNVTGSFFFQQDQIADFIDLNWRVKRLFGKSGRHVFVACFPKSGSTFLVKSIMHLTGFDYHLFINAFGKNEHDVYEPQLLSKWHQNTVTHQHCRATDNNVRLLLKYRIKPIVLVRNIFDCIVSMRDHLVRENLDWPMAWVPREFLDYDDVKQYDFVIDFFSPWYFNFFSSWEAFSKQRESIEVKWLLYEEFIENGEESIMRVLKHSGLQQNYSSEEIQLAMKSASGQGPEKSRLNKGITGRGMEILSPTQVNRIRDLAKFYRSTDFTKIGL